MCMREELAVPNFRTGWLEFHCSTLCGVGKSLLSGWTSYLVGT